MQFELNLKGLNYYTLSLNFLKKSFFLTMWCFLKQKSK